MVNEMSKHLIGARHWAKIENTFEQGADEDSYLTATYSGRGMYGQKCIGVVGTLSDFFRFVTVLALVFDVEDIHEYEELVEEIGDAVCTDSMGRNTVYYLPGWKVEEDV